MCAPVRPQCLRPSYARPGIIGPLRPERIRNEVNESPKMNDDATMKVTVTRFLASPSKHPDLKPIDILIVAHLMTRKAEDHCVWPSPLTLARMFNTDDKTVSRSLVRLTRVGYVSQQHRKGRTSFYALNYEV